MAAVQEPKKAPSAYFIFIREHRADLVKELGDTAKFGKFAAAKWIALTDDEQKPYVRKAATLKAKYDEDLAKFRSAGGIVGQKRKQRAEKKKAKAEKAKKKAGNAGKPKSPAGGAYGCFLAEKRSEIMKIIPAGSPCTMIGRIAGEQWQMLSDNAKAPYQNLYETKKAQYEVKLKMWKEAKEAGDEDEGEDNREEDGGDDNKATPKKVKKKITLKKTPVKAYSARQNIVEVADEAKRLGYTLKLQKLMEKPMTCGMSAATVLACLKEANGSVITTKKNLSAAGA